MAIDWFDFNFLGFLSSTAIALCALFVMFSRYFGLLLCVAWAFLSVSIYVSDISYSAACVTWIGFILAIPVVWPIALDRSAKSKKQNPEPIEVKINTFEKYAQYVVSSELNKKYPAPPDIVRKRLWVAAQLPVHY